MPLPFRPALARGAARGLRVVQGGRTEALRRALGKRTGQAWHREAPVIKGTPYGQVELDVLGPEGYEKTVRRGPAARYSPRATAEQQMRAEALRRHAEERGAPTEDPRTWAGEDVGGELREEAGLTAQPTASAALRKRFQLRHGWDPKWMTDEWVQRQLDLNLPPGGGLPEEP